MRARPVLMLCLLLGVPACSGSGSQKPWEAGRAVKIEDLRGPLVSARRVAVEVSRKKYIEALENGGSNNRARLVEVYNRYKSPDMPPEYRLFDILPGSVYAALGLKTADIVLAADGYVIPSPLLFWRFLNLLKIQDQATLEIVRRGTSMVFEYRFVE